MKIKNTWIPLKNFTKSLCHSDWQLGVGTWNVKDSLTGDLVKPFETIFWNKTFGNATVSLTNYNKAIKNGNQNIISKMKSLGLPLDIKI